MTRVVRWVRMKKYPIDTVTRLTRILFAYIHLQSGLFFTSSMSPHVFTAIYWDRTRQLVFHLTTIIIIKLQTFYSQYFYDSPSRRVLLQKDLLSRMCPLNFFAIYFMKSDLKIFHHVNLFDSDINYFDTLCIVVTLFWAIIHHFLQITSSNVYNSL